MFKLWSFREIFYKINGLPHTMNAMAPEANKKFLSTFFNTPLVFLSSLMLSRACKFVSNPFDFKKIKFEIRKEGGQFSNHYFF